MPKKQTEELDQEGEVSEDDSLEQEESEETPESEVSPSESEEPSEVPEGYVKKDRLDKMMSSYQEALRARRAAEDRMAQLETAQSQPQASAEEKWLDYLETKLRGRQETRRTIEEQAAARELEEVSNFHPDLKQKEILDTAIKYNVNLSTAANILSEISKTRSTSKALTAKELARKKQAGKFGGRPGVVKSSGLTAYKRKKDETPDEAFDREFEQGLKELGIEQ